MPKKYYLYLDESGDFDKDTQNPKKKQCLVGGFLCDVEINLDKLKKQVIDCWKTAVPEDAELDNSEIFKKVNHATELVIKGTITQLQCAELHKLIMELAQKNGELVVFENFEKAYIVDSTRTYINILADGVVQLYSKLALENPKDDIELNVIAGYRRDMTCNEIKYIPIEEYTKQLNEKIVINRIKNTLPVTRSNKAPITVRCEDDKGNSALVLCDYICHFYFTRSSACFKEKMQDGSSYSTRLKAMYKEEFMFTLKGDTKKERVYALINDQAYAAALYEICTGKMNPKFLPIVIDNLSSLSEKAIRNHLNALSDYLNTIIASLRDYELGLSFIESAEKIAFALSDSGRRDPFFEFDILLHKLAIYDHQGKLFEMESLFDKANELLPLIINHAENLDYVLMYYNRYSIYLFDTFQTEKACELIERVITSFAAYELMVSELKDIANSMNFIDGPHNNEFRSINLGKLFGTQVQNICYLMKQGCGTYEQAVEMSDNAIKHLADRKGDLNRQFQYRFAVELANNNYEEAERLLLKGCELNSLQEIMTKKSPPNDAFTWYHVSAFLKALVEAKGKNAKGSGILRQINQSNKWFFLSADTHPCFETCANLGAALYKMGAPIETVSKYYLSAIKSNSAEALCFRLIKLMIAAEYAYILIQNKHVDVASVIGSMKDEIQSLKTEKLMPSILGVVNQAEDIINSKAWDELIPFSHKRLY